MADCPARCAVPEGVFDRGDEVRSDRLCGQLLMRETDEERHAAALCTQSQVNKKAGRKATPTISTAQRPLQSPLLSSHQTNQRHFLALFNFKVGACQHWCSKERDTTSDVILALSCNHRTVISIDCDSASERSVECSGTASSVSVLVHTSLKPEACVASELRNEACSLFCSCSRRGTIGGRTTRQHTAVEPATDHLDSNTYLIIPRRPSHNRPHSTFSLRRRPTVC